jgi:hypothetical protein
MAVEAGEEQRGRVTGLPGGVGCQHGRGWYSARGHDVEDPGLALDGVVGVVRLPTATSPAAKHHGAPELRRR